MSYTCMTNKRSSRKKGKTTLRHSELRVVLYDQHTGEREYQPGQSILLLLSTSIRYEKSNPAHAIGIEFGLEDVEIS